MAIIRFLIFVLLTALWVVLLNYSPSELPIVGDSFQHSSVASMPPLGRFLDPFNGFWQNAEFLRPSLPSQKHLEQLSAPVKVVYDQRLVPHIFAQNDKDLTFMQGYVTAQFRLWQMEFQTHAAAGRLSEIVGEKALAYDLHQRRKGMVFAAENSLKAVEKNPQTAELIKAYTQGVNAYIQELSYKKLPLEYKLLNYAPENWTTLKTALLLKYMADDLTGRDDDLALTNALALLGENDFAQLFPDFAKGQDPIVPSDQGYDFKAIATPHKPLPTPSAPKTTAPDTSSTFDLFGKDSTLSLLRLPYYEQPDPNWGSNNWAVSPSKSALNKAILCNDPHLGLNLPSLWFELQLSTPESNVYGVSLPGAPGIIIGFNKHIAWGVTNASRDVRDWFKIQFKDTTHRQYWYDNQWKNSSQRIETIEVRNGATVMDTVIYTHYGPVPFLNDSLVSEQQKNLSLKWKAFVGSNEALTFYYLNRAKNYDDFVAAIQYYECPGQNFVYADATGNIAIWQQGKFPIRWKGQGKLLLDGSRSDNDWEGYIPFAHNPHIKNPERGFVSSANQHPTDSLYPYYYGGIFEFYRNRRLNQQLANMQDITIEDMKHLQCDNYNLQAAEGMHALLSYLDTTQLKPNELEMYRILSAWDFNNHPQLIAPTIYTVLADKIYDNLWDELPEDKNTPLVRPNAYITNQLLVTQPKSKFIDIKNTPEKETIQLLVQLSFRQTADSLERWEAANGTGRTWAKFKNTTLRHLSRLPALGLNELPIGGGKGILNAASTNWGPSWRMIVMLGDDKVEAFGIYPGGQSGNPGSRYYANFVDKWAAGEYNRLSFWAEDQTIPQSEILWVQDFE